MIKNLVDLKSLVDEVVVDSFHGKSVDMARGDEDKDTQFEYAVKDAFESGFAQRKNKPAEMIGEKCHCNDQYDLDLTFYARLTANSEVFGS